MPKTLSSRSQEILAAIADEIKENNISSFSYQEKPERGKLIVSLYEIHFDPIPNFLTRLIVDIVKASAVAIEQPVEYTEALECMRFKSAKMSIDSEEDDADEYESDEYESDDEDGPTYQQTLEELVQSSNCPIVCIDAPKKVTALTYEQACKQSAEEGRKLDSLRNAFMAHALLHFVPGKTIVTINGMAHEQDLCVQLKDLDSEIQMMPIGYNVDETAAKATVTFKTGKYGAVFTITAPDEESLRDKTFIAALTSALKNNYPHPKVTPSFESYLTFFNPAPYPFLHATSAQAMLPVLPEIEPVLMCV